VLRRHPAGQLLVDLLDERHWPVDAGFPRLLLGLLELPVPAAQLPLEVTVAAREAAEPDGVDVHLVEGDQDVDEILAGLLASRSSRAASVCAALRRMYPSTKSMT